MKLRVIWFNRNKGFGEGETTTGAVVFFTVFHTGGRYVKPGQLITIKELES